MDWSTWVKSLPTSLRSKTLITWLSPIQWICWENGGNLQKAFNEGLRNRYRLSPDNDRMQNNTHQPTSNPLQNNYGQPIRTPLLSKQQLGDEPTQGHLHQTKNCMKEWYDRQNNWQYASLTVGRRVYAQDEKTKLWEPSVIIQATKKPRSYLAENNNRGIHHRNQQFLRPARIESIRSTFSCWRKHLRKTPDFTLSRHPTILKWEQHPYMLHICLKWDSISIDASYYTDLT